MHPVCPNLLFLSGGAQFTKSSCEQYFFAKNPVVAVCSALQALLATYLQSLEFLTQAPFSTLLPILMQSTSLLTSLLKSISKSGKLFVSNLHLASVTKNASVPITQHPSWHCALELQLESVPSNTPLLTSHLVFG